MVGGIQLVTDHGTMASTETDEDRQSATLVEGNAHGFARKQFGAKMSKAHKISHGYCTVPSIEDLTKHTNQQSASNRNHGGRKCQKDPHKEGNVKNGI